MNLSIGIFYEKNCLIEIKDLKVQFKLKDKTVKAVDGVSWHINKGETLAVVEQSGSGKSVTALSLMRLRIILEVKL